MYKNVLQAIEGVEIFPLISLVIFFVFFMLVVLWFVKADPQHLKKMAGLPLDPASAGETRNHQLNFSERNQDVSNI
jgi:cytochrome c oxidase cbb3-type subunit IV